VRFADGSKFKGEYKNGKRNGSAIEEDKDGNRFEGTYVDDQRDGRFVEKDRNGNITAQGNYTRGHRQVR
jgi:antitoxin component YwqK of YwqJK toxin-antitoxin module